MLNNEWKDLLICFCLLMNSHCILGLGNIVHVPFMPMMHTGLKMKQKDELCAETERGESCHVQSECGFSVGQWSSEVE